MDKQKRARLKARLKSQFHTRFYGGGWPELLRFAALFLAYFITAKIGLSIGAVNKFATLIWAPTGIALSFLLIFGRRFWPSIFAAAFLVNFITGASLLGALGIATGNTLEAVLGFYLCWAWQTDFHLSLDRLKDVIVLIFRGAVLSTLLSALIGVGSLFLTGAIGSDQLLATFFQWWTGDAMGDFIVAPLILTWFARQRVERFNWRQDGLVGDALFCVACVGISWVILSGVIQSEMAPVVGLKGIYILIPLQLWASMRFGQRGSTLLMLFISVMGLVYTLQRKGPFSGAQVDASLQHLAIFMVVVATTALCIAAVASEREFERKSLEQTTKELRLTEISLRTAKEAAEAANNAKSAFLANMSHEIRTPLGAVLGFSELLRQADLPDVEKVNCADAIRRNGQLLSNIINDVLDLSKIEAGKLEIEKHSVDLAEIMADFRSLLELAANEKGIALRVIMDGALPNRVMTDPLRIRQILINVVGNAIKFTEHGSVTVHVKLVRTADGPAKLVFEVKDTGRGISPNQAARLFMPFSQADASTTRKFGGTGLGLMLSRRLAQLLGGDVKLAESKVGHGSTFVVTLDPGEIKKVSMQKFGTQLEPPRPSKSRAPIELINMHVLVVDDSRDNQILISHFLERAHVVVEIANNGREGVEQALQKSFDVILMDLQMPEMDGYEATKTLRARGYKQPIIALTAHAMKEERAKCLENGFDEHVSKPIHYDTLMSTLASFAKPKGQKLNELT